MSPKKRFAPEALATIHKDRILGVRAGRGSTHRVVGIWAVVVKGRVFVRSWGLKQRGWWLTFLEDPQGIMVIGTKRIRVRAIQTRSEAIKGLVNRAYKEKYHSPGDIQYVKDMSRKKSRETTTELVPIK